MALFASPELTALRLTDEQARATQEDVQSKLAAANEKISRLRQQQDDLALSVILLEPGAKEQHTALGAEIDAASSEARLLQSAMKQAKQKAEQASAARRAAEEDARIKKFVDKSSKRDASGKKIQGLITELDQAFRDLIREADEAQTAYVGKIPYLGAQSFMFSRATLVDAVAYELYRQSWPEWRGSGVLPDRPAPALPGAEHPGAILTGMPHHKSAKENCPSLVDRLREATSFAEAVQRGHRRYDGKPVDQPADADPTTGEAAP